MKKIFVGIITMLNVALLPATVLPTNTITRDDLKAQNCTLVVKSSSQIIFSYTYASNNWYYYPALFIDNTQNQYALLSRVGSTNSFTYSLTASKLSEGEHKAGYVTEQATYCSNMYKFYVKRPTTNSNSCSKTKKDIYIETNNTKRWEKSLDNGNTWTNISCTSRMYTESNPSAGKVMYRALNGDNTYSDVVTITYVDAVPSTIQALPATSTKTVDESITLTADVTDNGYTYQWKKDGTDISGAKSRTYTISSIKSSHAGNYTCYVSNGCNGITTTTAKLTVNKCAQIIDFPEIPTQTYASGLTYTLPKTTNKGLTITYQSMNTSVATVSGNVLTIKAPGTAIISASQVGNDDYLEATQVSRTLTVNKRSQVITFDEIPEKTYEDLPFTLPQITNEGLTISYSSTNISVATVNGNTVTILKPGTTDIIATQAGDATHYAAAEVSQTLVVKKAAQAITFGSLDSKTYGDAPFELNKVTNKNLTITYSSNDASIASIEDNIVTINKPGTVTITANQAGNAYYLAAEPIEQTLTINKANQTINFPALESRAYDSGDFELQRLTDKELIIVYKSSNPEVATISNNVVHIVGAGDTEITASQEGDEYYNAAPTVSQSLTITKAYQTIEFAELDECVYGQEPITLSATVNSSLAIEYESSDYSVATIDGNQLSIVGAGQCYITASAAGNKNYYTATPVERTLIVNKAQPTLTFAPLENEYTYGDSPIALVANSSSGNVEFASSNPTKLMIVGTNAMIQGAGEFTITATLAEDANHLSASVAQTITVRKANLTVAANNASRIYGDENPEFSYTFKGFVNGDTKSDLTATIHVSSEATAISPAGNYEIIAEASEDDNYEIICKKGVLSINKAPLTITAKEISREYGENNPDFVFTYEGFKNDEDSTALSILPVAYTTAKKSSTAGTYPIYVSGADAPNYEIAYKEGSLLISKAPLTIKALDVTRKRLDENPKFELSITGYKLEDTINDLDKLPTIQCEADKNSPAGTYPIVLLNDGYATNYEYLLINGTLTVEKLQFTIIVSSGDETMGTVVGGGIFEEETEITISAIPQPHYYFVKWDDGNTDISRTFVVSQNATYTAFFAIERCTITLSSSDETMGTVSGGGEYNYGTIVEVTALPHYGYHFTQWQDGNTDNPRKIFVSSDYSYKATFAKNIYTITKKTDATQGVINGPSQAAYLDQVTLTAVPNYGYHFTQWSDGLTDNPRTFTITQDTIFTAEFAPIVTPKTFTIIFVDYDGTIISTQVINEGSTPTPPANPTRLDDEYYTYVFSGWTPNIVEATEDATYTATYDKTPKEDHGQAEVVQTTEVTATPTDDGSVVITWTEVDGATIYTVEIRKNGELICTLVFNENGQLLAINLSAPARDGHGRRVTTATQAGKGWTYTINGLNANTTYTYSVKAKDENGSTLFEQSVEFSTGSLQAIEDVNANIKAVKFFRKNQILIQKGDKTFDLRGQEVK